MHIVHLLRDPADERAARTISQQAAEHKVTVVLLQDAVYASPIRGVSTVACQDDCQYRRVDTWSDTRDYHGIVNLLAQADRIVSW